MFLDNHCVLKVAKNSIKKKANVNFLVNYYTGSDAHSFLSMEKYILRQYGMGMVCLDAAQRPAGAK